MNKASNSSKEMVLIINGPNLNILGTRQTELYGKISLENLKTLCINKGKELSLSIDFRQSNHEGILIDWINEAVNKFDAIIINAAAYSHTSIAILDALIIFDKPIIEVHISDISKRELFRSKSYISEISSEIISGKGIDGYLIALDLLKNIYLKK